MEAALAWFDETHELRAADGHFAWRRTGLPAAGGLGDQDARLMQQLRLLRAVGNQLLREQLARQQRQREIDAWRRERAEAR